MLLRPKNEAPIRNPYVSVCNDNQGASNGLKNRCGEIWAC